MRIEVKLAIGMAIALSPGLACFGCPPEEPFEIDAEPFSLYELRSANRYAETDRQRCKRLCDYVTESHYVNTVDDCALQFEAGIDTALGSDDTGDFDTGGADVIAGAVSCSGMYQELCKGGRHPLGLVLQEDSVGELPATLARFARDERAAVVAFEQLADHLATWNAPADLVARCRHAADQERNHARLMSCEAELRGAAVPDFQVADTAPSLLELALNNAAEGCANESAAALVAAVLARTAPTKSLRAAFATIAVEEAQHAELSFDLHAWFLDQLAPDERSILDQALSDALDRIPALVANEARTLPPELPLGPVEAATRAGRTLRAQLA